MNATQLLRNERESITELLGSLSPEEWQASTLCEGWTVLDLAAHMVAREDKPLKYIAGTVTSGKIGPEPQSLLRRVRSRGPQSLLRALRAGPPLIYRLPGPAAIGNLIENWIHNEDLRRGGLNRPRVTPPETQQALWSTLHVLGRVMLRGVRTSGIVALVRPEGKAMAFRVGDAMPRKADPAEASVRMLGEPGELVLFLLGRKQAAQVTFEGDAALIKALRTTEMKI